MPKNGLRIFYTIFRREVCYTPHVATTSSIQKSDLKKLAKRPFLNFILVNSSHYALMTCATIYCYGFRFVVALLISYMLFRLLYIIST